MHAWLISKGINPVAAARMIEAARRFGQDI